MIKSWIKAQMKTLLGLSALTGLTFLTGCAVTPTTITQTPADIQVPNLSRPAPTRGSIYSTGAYRPMFEGRRASMVGDTITVTITENTTATKGSTGLSSKKGAASSVLVNSSGSNEQPYFNGTNANSVELEQNSNIANTFVGSLTANVLEVRPNGYLVIAGEKQVAFDLGTEFVRFSGVVNPATITNENSVASNTIADARIEYRTNGTMDSAALAKTFLRFFQSIVPM
jgi:flagellar L-ring protein precursor FlgH